MRVEAASIEQVRIARGGAVTILTAAEGSAARDVEQLGRDASTRFELHRSDVTGHYSIVQFHGPEIEADETLVATARTAAGVRQMVDDLKRRVNRRWDLVADMHKLDEEGSRAEAHAKDEKLGELAERGFHDFRKRVGMTDKITVPRSV